jgi:predicted DNA-binding antitoxin AbrB/MazE fold protein
MHTIDAIYDHGVFRPIQPLALPEGTRVQLRVEQLADKKQVAETSKDSQADGEIPTLLERMKDFVGTVHDLPSDASVNLDHYLYGTPKRQ